MRISLLLLWTFFAPAILANESGISSDFEISLISEENISRGFYTQDVQADEVTRINLGVTKAFNLNQYSSALFSARFQNDAYAAFYKLSSRQLTLKADYIFQTGLRFSNPTYFFSLLLTEADYDSVLRDSTLFAMSVRVLKRITTKIKISTCLSFKKREADSNVFDIDSTDLFILADYKLNKKFSLYLSYTLQDTGSVSTITTNDADFLAQQIGYQTINEADAAGALLPDDAFGGISAAQFAYQNKANSRVLLFGFNMRLSRGQAIDLSVQTVKTQLDTGLEYNNYLLTLSYLARF